VTSPTCKHTAPITVEDRLLIKTSHIDKDWTVDRVTVEQKAV